jgi:hypothetical protein
MWMNHPDAASEATIRDALAKLDAMDVQRHRFNINLFTLEMRWRMANRKRALAEHAKLLEDTRRLMDVDIN